MGRRPSANGEIVNAIKELEKQIRILKIAIEQKMHIANGS